MLFRSPGGLKCYYRWPILAARFGPDLQPAEPDPAGAVRESQNVAKVATQKSGQLGTLFEILQSAHTVAFLPARALS